MSRTMLALGDYRFSMETAAYDRLRRTDAWRWATQELVGAEPVLQFMGRGAATIELSGTIFPHYKGGLGQVAAMRAEADTGEPRILVDERGLVSGKWAITGIEETGTRFMDDGASRQVDFRLSLTHYTEVA